MLNVAFKQVVPAGEQYMFSKRHPNDQGQATRLVGREVGHE